MSLEMVEIMLPAFAECLVLVGIHSYLGIHVIQRKVIFVDLALAQIAALGSTFAFLFGIDPYSTGGYWFSLGFTVLGAAIFSLSRIRNEKIPQEAVIGLVYALAAALAILVIDKAPHGAEHIKEIMTGNILWVSWREIFTAAVVYAIVGLFHFYYRDKFILISRDPELAYQKGLNIRLWDFLFYVSFGIVITHSVSTAGVLLVFVFLVVPAIATIMITEKLWLQLVLGWSMGTFVSMLGLYISYVADLPSGPTVVATYGLVLLLTTLGLYVLRSANKIIALRNIGLGLAIFLLAIFFFWIMGKEFQHLDHAPNKMSHSTHSHEPGTSDQAQHEFILSDAQLKEILSGDIGVDSLMKLYSQVNNPFQKFEIAKQICNQDQKLGSQKLIDFLEVGEIPFLRQKALDILVSFSGTTFQYDALKEPSQNRPALKKWLQWWEDRF